MITKELSDLFRRPEDDPDCIEFEKRIRYELKEVRWVIAGVNHRKRKLVCDRLTVLETVATNSNIIRVLERDDCYDLNVRYMLEAVEDYAHPDESRIFVYQFDNRRERQQAPTIWASLREIPPYLDALRRKQVLDDFARI